MDELENVVVVCEITDKHCCVEPDIELVVPPILSLTFKYDPAEGEARRKQWPLDIISKLFRHHAEVQ